MKQGIKATAAAVVVTALAIAVPWALITVIGNPWPAEGISPTSPLTDGAIIGLVAIIVWVLWTQLMVCLVAEAVAVFTNDRVQLGTPLTLGIQRQLARQLVTAIVITAVAAPAIVMGGGAVADATATPTPTATTTTTATTAAKTSTTDVTPRPQAPVLSKHQQKKATTVTVMRLDTLMEISERVLGNSDRWTEIAALNEGRAMNDGSTFRSADYIRPGWELLVPATTQNGTNPGSHVVKPGENLSGIAHDELDDATRWPELYQQNRDVIGPDPDLILPGQVIDLPTLPGQASATTADHATTAPATAPHPTPGQPVAPAPPTTADTGPAIPAPAPVPAPGHGDGAIPESAAPETVTDPDTAAATSILSAPWVVPSLAGGALLASALLLMLRRRRREQFRARRPGRAIALPTPDLTPFEKTITVAGHPMEKPIEFLDTALRQLAADIAAAHQAAPPVAAVELTETFATLHLTEPADLSSPWTGTADKLHWTAPTSTVLNDGAHDAPAPFPLLATVGRDDAGHWWLLNLEHLGTITISGNTQRARDLLRYISCELSLAPWADSARIDAVGIGSEAARMNPTRTRHHTVDTAAADNVLASALEMLDRSDNFDIDTPTGRATQIDDELWLAHLLLVDAGQADEESLQHLIQLIADQPNRTGVSVVLADRTLEGGFAIDLSTPGRLRVAKAGLDLIPVGLTTEAADGSAQLLEQSQDVADVPVPVDTTAVDGWEAFTDNSGAIRREYTLPRNVQEIHELADQEPARSMLEDKDQNYVDAAAVTVEDLEQIAPRVPVNVCDAIEAADPTLDADYQAWVNHDPTRPRLRLLGNVKLTGCGEAGEAADRFAFYTELAAYLATKSRYGATTDEVVEAFGYKNRNRVRVDMTVLRGWLGTNPTTGQPFLPEAANAPAKREHGKYVYQLDTGPSGLIVDTKLFERKKTRAHARGEAGMPDLRQALLLVDRVPFSMLRDDGWSWMLDSLNSDRVDLQVARMISDSAHLLTTHYLKHGEVQDAFAVAKIGVLAAPYEEVMQLNLARVLKADGRGDEAEQMLRDEVYHRSEDGLAPKDLSDRTKAIISKWKATG